MSKPTNNYFVFANMPVGVYKGSIWDTGTILETQEYYFTLEDNLTYKPKRGDMVIFKEFKTKVYWGQAILDSSAEEVEDEESTVIRFRLKGLKIWFYKLDKDTVHNDLSNLDTRARIVSITEKDFNLIINTMEQKSPLTTDKQEQLKALWEKFKSSKASTKVHLVQELQWLTEQWQYYKGKILNDSLILEDYTNRLRNGLPAPGGYLSNFLERTTKEILGSSKPGNSYNFGVKLNEDSTTYYTQAREGIPKNEKASREEAEVYFNDNIKGLLKSIVKERDLPAKTRIIGDSNYSAKQILMKMVVLDNLGDFLHVYSGEWLDKLYREFVGGGEENKLLKSHQICLVAKKMLGVNDQDKGELVLLSRFLLQYINARAIVDRQNPNAILYGPPGTGKTHSVMETLDFVCQGNNSRYELLQFHPSFTYEDFIEGIKPKGVSKDGNIRFGLVNGAFKNFCMRAKNDPDNDYYFVVDEINRANLSTVFGETLTLLERDYRHKKGNSKNLLRTQYSALIEDLISEDGEDSTHKNLAYDYEDGKVKFGVPENVLFIGMMNDVDKSIDAFDIALRRRFKWLRKDCDYNVIREETKYKTTGEYSNIDWYVKSCKSLNKYISEELALGKSYEFGHSFFMKMSDIAFGQQITKVNMETLFNLYLKPTLKEYLRAVFAEVELDNRLNTALSKFSA